jgi:hypothetical protein
MINAMIEMETNSRKSTCGTPLDKGAN